MSIKEKLYNQCLEFVDNRFQTIQKTINEIQESLTSETKSSAGDKHETGRAMLQLEREKAGKQLSEIVKVKEALSKIDTSKSSKIIGLGSVVYTTQANYYIAISAGEFQINSEKIYAISPSTPIGKLLIGKTVGDTIVFRESSFEIIEVS
ncbi:GreA/GreB family elongation factor [Wocania ichthyoenteri]|uniref:GreA/GreB family elongation factor n=1 Tax=Wocania ichthyoenteri TaxID=1230531 RepID=UPI00053E16E7|nr:GreA/GreB family elongation factor [Wocania ichthyoenteri]